MVLNMLLAALGPQLSTQRDSKRSSDSETSDRRTMFLVLKPKPRFLKSWQTAGLPVHQKTPSENLLWRVDFHWRAGERDPCFLLPNLPVKEEWTRALNKRNGVRMKHGKDQEHS